MKSHEVTLPMGTIWYENIPEMWKYSPEKYKILIIDAPKSCEHLVKEICLKLFLPQLNGSSGVLGIRYETKDSQKLEVKIAVSDKIVPDSIVNIGLPTEFASVVEDELRFSIQEAPFLRGGLLEVAYAAWDNIYSNKLIFRLLSRSLIQLLRPDIYLANSEKVTSVIRDCLIKMSS